MRIAVVSDIHGNLGAFEAVVADLRQTSPDLVLHGGDLADSGANPVEIVDRIRDLGWAGVVGNTDEMLSTPEVFETFAAQSPALEALWNALREMAAWTREVLGEDRLAWLRRLPRIQHHGSLSLLHASPDHLWCAPMPEATDDELQTAYESITTPTAVYGHVHRPYIRRLPGRSIANSGSVGLPHDGDTRASYLLLDDSVPTIRRVAYDLPSELRALSASGLPHADWVGKILRSATPQMP